MKVFPCEKGNKGMSLLECMLALVIFSVGILGVLGLHGVILIGNNKAKNAIIARSLALSRLEHLERLPPDDPALELCGQAWDPNGNVWCHVDSGAPGDFPQNTDNPSGDPANADPLNINNLVDPGGNFRRYWHIEPGASGWQNTVNVRLRIEWQDLNVDIASGVKHYLTYSTIFAFPK